MENLYRKLLQKTFVEVLHAYTRGLDRVTQQGGEQ